MRYIWTPPFVRSRRHIDNRHYPPVNVYRMISDFPISVVIPHWQCSYYTIDKVETMYIKTLVYTGNTVNHTDRAMAASRATWSGVFVGTRFVEIENVHAGFSATTTCNWPSKFTFIFFESHFTCYFIIWMGRGRVLAIYRKAVSRQNNVI